MIKQLHKDELIEIWRIYTKYDTGIKTEKEITINIELLPMTAFNEIYNFVRETISKHEAEAEARKAAEKQAFVPPFTSLISRKINRRSLILFPKTGCLKSQYWKRRAGALSLSTMPTALRSHPPS